MGFACRLRGGALPILRAAFFKGKIFRMARIVFLLGAYFFVALAIIGVFLPGFPTVPFLILAAWFSAKGSERLHKWLYEHPKFGSTLINWEQEGAISRKSKIIAILMIFGSWVFLFYSIENSWFFAAITGVLLVVSLYLISRPEPERIGWVELNEAQRNEAKPITSDRE